MLTEKTHDIHDRSRGTYGAPRVHAALQSKGIRVGKKRVARLMKAAGLMGVSRRREPATTIRHTSARPAPDLVECDFTAEKPDQLCVADITYVPTDAGFLYLAGVLDVFSRRVTQRFLRRLIDDQSIANGVGDAGVRHGGSATQARKNGPLLRAGLAVFWSASQRCRDAGVRPSMGSVGDCYDNAMCESFFATLECELIERTSYPTRKEARLSVFDFIEGWYNSRRLHSALGYQSPIRYETAYHSQNDHNPKNTPLDKTQSLVAA